MCYDPYVGSVYRNNVFVGDQHISGDIFIRRSHFKLDPLLQPGSDASFNMCGSVTLNNNNNSAFKSFLHEVGHALGIGGAAGGHSATNVTSVVNYAADPADCSPYPADIMALYALYQTR